MAPATARLAQPAEVLLRARVAPHTTVLEFEPGPYLRLDAVGRWTAFADAHGTFRRTLDGRVVRRVRGRFVALRAREAGMIHDVAVRTAAEAAEVLREGGDAAPQLIGSRAELLARLDQARAWSTARMIAHEADLRRAWPEPTRILPPHRYRDLVILPATGCPNHACGFCAFYRERAFRVLDDEAFESHLQGVVGTLGAAVAERDGIFLGSASALSLHDDLLLRRLARIRTAVGIPRRGVAAFLDPDRAPRRTAAAFRRLREAGLVEATLGLETGLPALRERLGKRPDLSGVRATIDAMRTAGVGVGLTVLVGLGEGEDEHRHREATVAWIARLELDVGDYVHLSPLVRPDFGRVPNVVLCGWRRALLTTTRARVAPYLIERFAWLA